MKAYIKHTTLALVVAGLVMGCGRKEDSSSTVASAPSDPLNGTNWVGSCNDAAIFKVSYTDGKVVTKATQYADSSCDTPVLYVSSTAAYSVSGQDLDYTYEKVEMTLLNADFADACNESACLGVSTWKINKAVDISGKTRESDGQAYKKSGDKLYQIFKVDGSKLEFGDTSKRDGSSIETRPNTLETATFYTKE